MASKLSTELANRFKEVVLDGKWIAFTNYKELLKDLNRTEATTKVSTLNTIAALTFHINYYIEGVLQVLNGGPLDIKDKFSFDVPEINYEEDWQKLRARLIDNSEQFYEAIKQLSDKKIASSFVKKEYGTYQKNLEGMIEHCYYHMGQISIIKKMVREGKSN